MKIKVYTLVGCSVCEKLLTLLESNYIDFESYSCKDFPKQCDRIESISLCDIYPMVEISDHNIFLCLTRQYEDLGNRNKNNYTIYYFYSIDNMFSIIKNLYFK